MNRYTVYTAVGDYRDIWARDARHAAEIVARLTNGRGVAEKVERG